MDASVIQGLIGALPGGGVASLAVWFALRKDTQCTGLMQQLTDIAVKQATSNEQVASSINALRDAIRLGTKS
jgi:hypothetical protein